MASPKSIEETIPLPGGAMPRLGFGVYKSPRDVCVRSCHAALAAGYRHFDTAQFYENEAEVGEAIRSAPAPAPSRSDVFLTTKILSPAGSIDASHASCLSSVQKLDPSPSGYVDLFLVHSPNRGPAARKEMWLALERLHASGHARAIGVSNFGIGHIERLREFASVWPPHVNQLELHPWAQQREVVKYCQDNGIIVQAYCPIVRNQKAGDPTVAGIAERHGVSSNQVLIRYSLQKGWVPLPKSDTPERIKANADVYGFHLNEEDMAALDGLDQGAAGAIVQAADNE
ncbi:NADP-dependent oxidoreductase domain-containing protein [Plectosphaerella cucumerina]|uniref:NADP-dependent oxidoreductase domain-containing protein n=1 Tax=Plectosphaerella cucumerina TaxID=40658 RepID=A0A8K0X368_9PEZI|nr:NADP-dependent oxidoreductase domain-containing protein [Plectosphaerella cucumerina]